MNRFRPTVAIVDLDAVRANVARLMVDTTALMATVKADAYGHGAVHVARACLGAGATWLAVALVEEGIALREAGIDAPILVLSEFPRGAERDALGAALTPTVTSLAGVDAVAAASRDLGVETEVQIEVDTGMHRTGAWPMEAVGPIVRRAIDAGLRVGAIWTHFARADEDAVETAAQVRRLTHAIATARAMGAEASGVHAANSAGHLRHPETRFDVVRIGAALYGLEAGPGMTEGLVPALELRSAVGSVRRVPAGDGVSYGHRFRPDRATTIATVPIGYADGIPRVASPGAEVLLRGRRRPVVGTITMDHLMVDCGDDPVAEGDEVVLIGQRGGDRLRAEDLASHAGTIGYEIVTRIAPRVPREYRGAT